MTRERDIEQLLDAWFADGPMRVSDRAFDQSIERVHRQRQRPAWRLRPWRLPTMSTPVRVVTISGALILVIGGAIFLWAGRQPVTHVVPSPVVTQSPQPSDTTPPAESPSQSPSLPPTAAPTGPQVLKVGSVNAGEYSVPNFDAPFTFAIEREWGVCRIGCDRSGNFYIFHAGAGGSRSTGISFTRYASVYDDPCALGDRKPAPVTPKAFFEWLKTVPQVELGPVEANTVDGLPAMGADATIASTSACAGQGTISLGVSEAGTPTIDFGGERIRLYAIDVRGKLVVIGVTADAEDFTDAAAELDALISTLHFP
jgi:hypothetical protein